MPADKTSRFDGFWQARNPRERQTLIVGGAVLLVAALYGAVYAPLNQARGKLNERLQRLSADHRLLMTQVDEIRRLQTGSPVLRGQETDLRRRVDTVTRALGLREGEFRIDRLDGSLLQFSASPRPVRTWLEWMTELQRQGIGVKMANLKMAGGNDQASIEATLTAGPS